MICLWTQSNPRVLLQLPCNQILGSRHGREEEVTQQKEIQEDGDPTREQPCECGSQDDDRCKE